MDFRLPVFGACASLGIIGSYSIVPVLVGLSNDFSVGISTVQLVLAVYLISLAAGQFIVGALSDRFGTRIVLLGGIGLHILSCIACAIAPAFMLFLVARAIQGLSGSTGMVIALSAIGRSDPDRMAVRNGYLIAWLSIVTMAAPLLGGLVGEWVGWRAIFLVAAGIASLCLIFVALILPATADADAGRVGSELPEFMVSTLSLFKKPVFAVHILEIAFAVGAFYYFIGILPYAKENVFDLSPSELGVWLLVVGAGLPLGVLVGGRIPALRQPRLGVLAGATGMAAGSFLPVIFFSNGWVHPATLFFPIVMMAAAQTVLVSRAQIGAISVNLDMSGTAAGLCGTIQFTSGAIFTFVGGAMIGGATSFLPALSILALVCFGNLTIAMMHFAYAGKLAIAE